jgi:6-O-methylguanine DNA methyltransferase, DNA binding domain
MPANGNPARAARSSYGDVSPGAPRLARRLLGSVHAADLPWWRVVRADGSLAAGEEQRRRLEREGVPFRPGPPSGWIYGPRIVRVASPTDDGAVGSDRRVTKRT